LKFWNKPARQEKKVREDDFVADLDALDSRPVFFRFLGQLFEIPPISTGKLLKVYAAFMKVDALAKQSAISADDLIDTYTELFSSVCPEVTKDVVSKMSQAQAAALFTLVFDTVSGRVGASKKKLDLMSQMQAESQRG
jgi:hypothetical protein